MEMISELSTISHKHFHMFLPLHKILFDYGISDRCLNNQWRGNRGCLLSLNHIVWS